ncbi:cadherin domain-containing protein, partial [Novipirellula herctigrandis]
MIRTMTVNDWWIQARLAFDELKASAERAFQTETQTGKFTELTQLEDRVLMSASPIAIVAAPEADVNQDAASPSSSQSADAISETDQAETFAEELRTPSDTQALLDQVNGDLLSVIDGLSSDPDLATSDDLEPDHEQWVTERTDDADTSSSQSEIVFVDSNVANYQSIVSQFGDGVEVVVLDSETDGLTQISESLVGRREIDAIHVFSHGVDGAFQVGATWIDQFSVEWQADVIASWGTALSADADLLLYGCNVASTHEGLSFIERVADLTGADVAASSDDTGHASLGGDWDLEAQTGAIDVDAIDADDMRDWQHVLAITANGTATSEQSTSASTLTWSHTVASGSNRAMFVTLSIDGLGSSVTSVTYDGVALTQVGRTAGNHAVEIWRLVNPTVGTANVVVSLDASTAISAGAVTYNGVHQSTPTGTYASGSGTSTIALLSVSSASDELVIDVTNWDNHPVGYMTGGGQSQVWTETNVFHRGVSTTEAGAASVTMSSSVSTPTQWESGAVSIKAAADTSGGALWLTTGADVSSPSGAPGLAFWTEQTVIKLGDPNLEFEPEAGTSNGTFSSAIDFENFADASGDVNAIHYVGSAMTVGGVDLQAGDVLFTVTTNMAYTSANSVSPEPGDVYVFQPTTPGDYGSGTFTQVIDSSTLGIPSITAFSLVESSVTVGGNALQAGDFLYVAGDQDIRFYDVSAGNDFMLVDGWGSNFFGDFGGIDLVEQTMTLGGTSLNAGQIVAVSMDDAANMGTNSVSILQQDVLVLDVHPSNTTATVELLMEGADFGFDGSKDWDGLALVPAAASNTAPAIGLPGAAVNYTEGDGAVMIDATATVADSDSADFDTGTLTVDFTANATANDRLAIRNEGTGGGQIGVSGSDVTYNFGAGAVTIGTFAGGTDGATPLVITLNANATPAAAQALLRNITFENVSADPSTLARTVRFVLTDGDGGTCDAVTQTVNVAGVPSAVDALDDTFNTNEDTAGVFDVVANDVDPESQPITVLGFARTVANYDAGTSGAAPDPTSGAGGSWTLDETEDGDIGGGSVTAGAVADDLGTGFDAWNLQDNSNVAGAVRYTTSLSGADTALATANGWMLSTTARIADDLADDGAIYFAYGDGTTRFLAWFDLNIDGDLVVALPDNDGGHSLTITSGGTGIAEYHEFAIAYDAGTGTAAFLVDGVRVDDGTWDGYSTASTVGVVFGSGSSAQQGSVNFHRITMEVYDQSATTAAGATITNNGDGTVTYDPASNYHGADSFRYTVRDADGYLDSANAAVTVDSVNDAPIIDLNGSDGGGTAFATTFTEAGGAVNVTDADAVITDVDDNTYQNLNVNLIGFSDGADEQVVFAGYTFTYGTAEVVVQTVGSTDIEMDFDGSGFSVQKDGGGVLPQVDLQALIRGIKYDNLSLNPTAGDRVIGLATQDALGLLGPTASSTITVTPVNDAPATNDENYNVDEDTTLDVTAGGILSNDTDAEGDPLTARLVSGPNNGTLLLNPVGVAGQSNLTLNAADDRHASWSPDGSKIAFRSDRDGNDDIYVMDADGSNVTRLTFTGTATEGMPRWSPDGTKILFHSDQDGNDEIYVMDADGSNQTRLTNDASSDNGALWFPDGSKIAFRSDRDGDYEVYVMDVDGSNQTRLTFTVGDDSARDWSPDGSQLLFTSERDGNSELYLMDADGSNQTRLTNDPGSDGGASFSPDGSQIAFRTDRDGNNELYIMDADGTNLRRLTNSSGTDSGPDWSADGSQILFNGNNSGNFEVSVLDLESDGGFIYIPDANFNGADSFTYVANDGTEDSSVATVSITVDPVNDAPIGTDKTITVDEDTTHTFTLADFGFSDIDSDSFMQVWITALPSSGDLLLNGSTFAANNYIDASDITLGLLTYVPNVDEAGTGYATFEFQVQDDGGTANGGQDRDLTSNAITFNVTAINDAPTFVAPDGVALTDPSGAIDFVQAIVVQDDGKILVGGYGTGTNSYDQTIIRYNVDGSFDPTFGTDGVARVDTGGADYLHGMVLQSDGKIVLGGRTGSDFLLARLNQDGSLDTTFDGDGNNDGMITTVFSGSLDGIFDLVIDPNDKIVVTGMASSGGGNEDITIVRYNTDGSLDGTFGTGGVVQTGSPQDEQANAVRIDANGHIVVAGEMHNGTSYDFFLARYDKSTGALDTSFGGGGTGYVLTDFEGGIDEIQGMEILATGEILVSGYATVSGSMDLAVARFDNNGVLDATFGGGSGYVTVAIGLGTDKGTELAVQSDGKFVVVGETHNGTDNDVLAVRFNSNGTLDTGFGTGGTGVATFDLGVQEYGKAIAIQSDGSILLSGYTGELSSYDAITIRLNSDGTLDTGFGPEDTLDGAPTFVEDGASIVLDVDVQILDAELSGSDDFGGASVTLERNGAANAEDVFSATGNLVFNTGALELSSSNIGSYTNAAGTLTMTFAAGTTNAQVNEVMRSIAYSNSSGAPPTSVQIHWSFDDGNVTDQGSGGALSISGSTTVTISAANDIPVVADLDGDTLTYNEADGAVLLDQGTAAAVSDVDSANFDGGTITVDITAGGDSAEDVFGILHEGISAGQVAVSTNDVLYENVLVGSFSGGSGGSPLVITFNASATAETVTQVLNNITYENIDTVTPTTTTRSVSIVVTDGDGGTSSTISTSINVVSTNALPSTGISSTTAPKNVASTLIVLSGTDSDGSIESFVLSNLPANVTLYTDPALTVLATTGGDLPASSGSLTLYVVPDADWIGTTTFQFAARDNEGGLDATAATGTITITSVNDYAPIISSDGGGATATVSVDENSVTVTTVVASDADVPAQTLTYSISGGLDAAKFTIDSSTGVLTFIAAPDFETPTDVGSDNVYQVIVEVNDGAGGTDSQDLAVTVSNVNELPVGVDDNTSTDEDTVLTVAADGVLANDTDEDVIATATPGSTLNYDAFLDSDGNWGNTTAEAGFDFTLDNFGTEVTYNPSPTTSYGGITAAYSFSGTNSGAWMPSLESVSGNPSDASASFEVWFRTDSLTGQHIIFETGGVNNGTSLYQDGSVIRFATLTSDAVPDEVAVDLLTLYADPTAEFIQVIAVIDLEVGELRLYVDGAVQDTTPLSGINGTRWAGPDGTGLGKEYTNVTTGPAAGSGNLDGEIAIIRFYESAFDGAEAATNFAAITGDVLTVSEVEGNAANVGTQFALASGALLTVNADGSYEYDPNGQFESLASGNSTTDSFSYTVRDRSGATDTATVTVTINGVNDSPVITSDGGAATAALNAAENSTAVTTITSTDVDLPAQTLTYSIVGGADATLFTIDGSTGVLAFGSGPDRESNTDDDLNGVYEVTVQVSDGTAADTQAISVTITDVDEFDVGSISDSNGTTNELNENAANGTTVGVTALASDADATNNVITYSLDDDAGGRFAIDGSTGVVTVADGTLLDRETAASHDITVRATSSDGSFDTAVMTINVNDVDEFDVGTITDNDAAGNSVNENAANGTTVAVTALAADADATNNTITYSLDDNAGGRFAIDGASGVVTVADGTLLDRETAASHDITVRAASSDGSFNTQLMTINVNDVDEFDVGTITDSDAATNEIAEDANSGDSVGVTASVADADATNNTITYTLDDNAGGRFAIDGSTGEITVNAALDYETNSSHIVVVRAVSSDGSFNTQSFTINVTDVSESGATAIVDNDLADDSVSENATNGTTVGVTAFSDDVDATDTVSYSLDDNDGGRFSIDASTGIVTVAGAIDRETDGATRSITVRATSTDGSFQTRVFAIAIDDVDEFDVGAITDNDATANSVNENAANGTTVAVTALASDADATNNTILYSLDDDASGRFTIDGSTGVVTVADGTLLDRETAASHDITVRAASSDGSSNTQLMTINVNDVDEFDVGTITDSDGATNEIAEDANSGDSVGVTASAADADATNNTITYTLDDNAGGRFAIDGSTGEITVNATLDYETNSSHSVNVRATSSDGSFNTQNFTIAVTDVSESGATPIVDNDVASDSVAENSIIGTPVGVTAFSDDVDGSDTISYSLDDNDGGRFSINVSTGIVTVAGAIDRETDGATRSIMVRATSTDGSFQTRVFAIAIDDVDEFDVGAISDSDLGANGVNENAANGTTVGVTAFASDADA